MSSGPVSLSRHTLRQLKFVIPGGAITYYLGTHGVFWGLINEIGWESWAGCVNYVPLFVARRSDFTIILFYSSNYYHTGQLQSPH